MERRDRVIHNGGVEMDTTNRRLYTKVSEYLKRCQKSSNSPAPFFLPILTVEVSYDV